MAEQPSEVRWREAVVGAGGMSLDERWRTVTQQWLEAVIRYQALYDSNEPDLEKLKAASRHLYEVEQQRAALKNAIGI